MHVELYCVQNYKKKMRVCHTKVHTFTLMMFFYDFLIVNGTLVGEFGKEFDSYKTYFHLCVIIAQFFNRFIQIV